MEVYLNSNSKQDFIEALDTKFSPPPHHGEVYFNDLSELLNTVNLEEISELIPLKVPLIPEYESEETYSFGKNTIKIHFGSEQIKALIHPQWAHAISFIKRETTKNFHIFKEDDFLYLLNNKDCVGRFAISEYHLLQGKFSLQIVNTLYNNTESDWIGTFHASTICNNNEAIMLIGDSGNGKSTLSAILMANDIDVLADDFTPLSAENKEVYRYPSGISVKPGAFEILRPLFPNLDTFQEFKSTSKPINVKYIPPIKSFDEGPSHLPCTKIVYVKFHRNITSTIQNIGIEKILETLIPESWISPSDKNAKLFLEWIKELECFELNYSDNEFAVVNIKKLFNS